MTSAGIPAGSKIRASVYHFKNHVNQLSICIISWICQRAHFSLAHDQRFKKYASCGMQIALIGQQ